MTSVDEMIGILQTLKGNLELSESGQDSGILVSFRNGVLAGLIDLHECEFTPDGAANGYKREVHPPVAGDPT